MTTGMFLDIFLKYFIGTLTKDWAILIVIATFMACTALWFNHYDYKRAILYSRLTITGVTSFLILMHFHFGDSNFLHMEVVALIIAMSLAMIVGYMIAAYVVHNHQEPLGVVRRRIINKLRATADRLEFTSIRSQLSPPPANKTVEETLVVVKQAIIEHSDKIGMLL